MTAQRTPIYEADLQLETAPVNSLKEVCKRKEWGDNNTFRAGSDLDFTCFVSVCDLFGGNEGEGLCG